MSGVPVVTLKLFCDPRRSDVVVVVVFFCITKPHKNPELFDGFRVFVPPKFLIAFKSLSTFGFPDGEQAEELEDSLPSEISDDSGS